MPAALEGLSGGVASLTGGSTFDAITVSTGDSLTVRNAPLNSKVYLLSLWAVAQGAATVRIRSPKLHDNVQGLRYQIPATTVNPVFLPYMPQLLYPQDTLIVEANGTAAQVITVGMLLYYTDLPGAAARLATTDFVRSHMVNQFVEETSNAITGSTTYAGSVSINSSFDLMKANTDYALLGFKVSQRAAVIGYRGIDTGNLRVTGPGIPDDFQITSPWFMYISDLFGSPLIPVFNSANRFGILVDGIAGSGGGTTTVTAVLAELRP